MRVWFPSHFSNQQISKHRPKTLLILNTEINVSSAYIQGRWIKTSKIIVFQTPNSPAQGHKWPEPVLAAQGTTGTHPRWNTLHRRTTHTHPTHSDRDNVDTPSPLMCTDSSGMWKEPGVPIENSCRPGRTWQLLTDRGSG